MAASGAGTGFAGRPATNEVRFARVSREKRRTSVAMSGLPSLDFGRSQSVAQRDRAVSTDPSVQGFSLVELIVIIALVAIVTLFVGTTTMRMYRRYQLTSVTQEIQSLILATRMNAVQRNSNVVLFFDVPNYRVYSWADPDSNFIRDADEPIIREFVVPPNIDMRVSFDQYNGNVGLIHMIVFRGDGLLVQPSAAYSTAGNQVGHADPGVDCGSGCRGVFLANRNIIYPMGTPSPLDVFRLSVDQIGSGRVSKLKLTVGTSLYSPGPPWVWYDD